MIVDSMTQTEIADAFKKEYESEVIWKVQSITKDNKYRRYMLTHRSEEAHSFLPVEVRTKSKNTYIIQLKSVSYSDWKKNGFIFIVYLLYLSKHGLQAVMLAANTNEYLFYNSHLFDRYIERHLKCEIDKKAAIIKFFQNNPLVHKKRLASEKHPECVFGTIPEGVILGEQHSSTITSFNTFISTDQLYNDQIALDTLQKSEMISYLEKYYENGYLVN